MPPHNLFENMFGPYLLACLQWKHPFTLVQAFVIRWSIMRTFSHITSKTNKLTWRTAQEPKILLLENTKQLFCTEICSRTLWRKCKQYILQLDYFNSCLNVYLFFIFLGIEFHSMLADTIVYCWPDHTQAYWYSCWYQYLFENLLLSLICHCS